MLVKLLPYLPYSIYFHKTSIINHSTLITADTTNTLTGYVLTVSRISHPHAIISYDNVIRYFYNIIKCLGCNFLNTLSLLLHLKI